MDNNFTLTQVIKAAKGETARAKATKAWRLSKASQRLLAASAFEGGYAILTAREVNAIYAEANAGESLMYARTDDKCVWALHAGRPNAYGRVAITIAPIEN